MTGPLARQNEAVTQMNVAALNAGVSETEALTALRQYKEHRSTHDARDWEIERIYRAIAKGKTVISVNSAIQNAGLDEKGRPRLAICRADYLLCVWSAWTDEFSFSGRAERLGRTFAEIKVPYPGARWQPSQQASVPRIPPQHRPATAELGKYHILWEAEWQDIPKDPYLLRKIGKDAWVVLAAWDLTAVELAVLRAHRGEQTKVAHPYGLMLSR